MPDSENMMRHRQNGHTLVMEGHTPGGEARRPPIGGHSTLAGCASERSLKPTRTPEKDNTLMPYYYALSGGDYPMIET